MHHSLGKEPHHVHPLFPGDMPKGPKVKGQRSQFTHSSLGKDTQDTCTTAWVKSHTMCTLYSQGTCTLAWVKTPRTQGMFTQAGTPVFWGGCSQSSLHTAWSKFTQPACTHTWVRTPPCTPSIPRGHAKGPKVKGQRSQFTHSSLGKDTQDTCTTAWVKSPTMYTLYSQGTCQRPKGQRSKEPVYPL